MFLYLYKISQSQEDNREFSAIKPRWESVSLTQASLACIIFIEATRGRSYKMIHINLCEKSTQVQRAITHPMLWYPSAFCFILILVVFSLRFLLSWKRKSLFLRRRPEHGTYTINCMRKLYLHDFYGFEVPMKSINHGKDLTNYFYYDLNNIVYYI